MTEEVEEKKEEEKRVNMICEVHLHGGNVIKKLANVRKGEQDAFSSSIVKQIGSESSKWFYFVDQEKPLKSSLIQISMIEYVNIYEML